MSRSPVTAPQRSPVQPTGQLTRGDRIIVTTTSGEHLTYVVSGTPQAVLSRRRRGAQLLRGQRIALAGPLPQNYPARRLVTVGMLQQAGASPKSTRLGRPRLRVVNPATASWDWSSLPAVGLLALPPGASRTLVSPL